MRSSLTMARSNHAPYNMAAMACSRCDGIRQLKSLLRPGQLPGFFLPATAPVAGRVEIAAVANRPRIGRTWLRRRADHCADHATCDCAHGSEYDGAGSRADRGAG